MLRKRPYLLQECTQEPLIHHNPMEKMLVTLLGLSRECQHFCLCGIRLLLLFFVGGGGVCFVYVCVGAPTPC